MNFTERFAFLFQSNQRSRGVYTEKGMYTEETAPNIKHFEQHFKGEKGLGLVPILDDGSCMWGAIDIDEHEEHKEIDIFDLEKQVRYHDLPLMVCRSKSGGAHLYLFCMEPVPAKLVRQVLKDWATVLHHGDAEIFPKQDKLAGAGKKRQFGNWINICYFNADDTNRFCVEGNKKINLEYFVEVAESRRVSASILVERSEGDHSEAPPCIQKILASGVAPGLRNEALYNICIYLKQAYPEKWRDKAFDINARVFAEPLPHGEARKTISSVAKRDYRYKCKDDPCRPFCNSSVCVERKYGITKEESNEIFIGQQPDFTTLKKYLTDPVRWGLCVNEVEIPLSTSEIMDHRRVREAVADKLTTVIPPMKNDKWLAVLKKLMDSAILIDVPDEASPAGLVWQHLIQFLQRADLDSDGTDKVDRGMLLRGMPVVQEKDGNKHVYFRGSDFVTYLRRNRAEDLKGPNLWFALKKNGVDHGSLRIGGTTRQVWSLPLHELQNYEYEDEMPEINLEF